MIWSRFPKLECVLDVVYNPARTQLLLDAEKLGVTAMSGLAMLVIQAAAAAERFTGGKPKNSVEVVLADIGRGMQNILLVGMPGQRQDHDRHGSGRKAWTAFF